MDSVFSRNLGFSSQNYKLLKWAWTTVVLLLSVLFVGIIRHFPLSLSLPGSLSRSTGRLLLCNHKTVWILSKHYNEMVCNYSLAMSWAQLYHEFSVSFAHCLWVGSNYQSKLEIWYLVRSILHSRFSTENVGIPFRFCQMCNLTSIINHRVFFFLVCHFVCIRFSHSTNYFNGFFSNIISKSKNILTIQFKNMHFNICADIDSTK